ncbi:MAG: hypothetical protein ACRCZF_04705, partial [Gemmataceae bacterium]
MNDSTAWQLDTLTDQLTAALLQPEFRRLTIGGTPRRGPAPFERIIIRPIELRGERQWQFQMYSDRQCHTKNYPAPKLDTALKPFVD